MARKRRKDGRSLFKVFKSLRKFHATLKVFRSNIENALGVDVAGREGGAGGGGPFSGVDREFSTAQRIGAGIYGGLQSGWARMSQWARSGPGAAKGPVGTAGQFNRPWDTAYIPRSSSGAPLQFDPNYEQHIKSREASYVSGIAPGHGGPGYDAWTRYYNNGTGPQKDFSALTQNLGKRILRMGGNVPAQVRAQAAAAVNGSSNKAVKEGDLLEGFRDYLGIDESGASKLNALVGQIKGVFGRAYQFAALSHMAQQPGPVSGLASAQMGAEVVGMAEGVLHSKFTETLAEKVTDSIFKNPALGVKFIHGLGRMLRLGGAVAQVGILAGTAAMSWAEEQFHTHLLQTGMAGMQRDFGIGSRVGGDINRTTRNDITSARNLFRFGMDYFGFTSGTEQMISSSVARQLSTRQRLRDQPGLLGVNAGEAIAIYAAKHGVSVDQLNQLERNEALDEAIDVGMRKVSGRGDVRFMAGKGINDWGTLLHFVAMGDIKADLREAEKKARDEFIFGEGDFTNHPGSPAVQEKERAARFQKQWAAQDPQKRVQFEHELRIIGMKHQAYQHRHQVQRFD